MEDDLFSEDNSQPTEETTPSFHTEKLPLSQIHPLPSSSPFLLKLPSFSFLQTTPFDPINYSESTDTFTNLSLTDSQESRQLKAYNVIRCSTLNSQRSNTKIIRWSDGSYSLRIGREYFEMNAIPNTDTKTVIFHQHNNTTSSTLLESVARPSGKFQVRPYDTSSAAHKRYSKAVLARHAKERKIKIAFTADDPEKQKAALERAEQDRIRMQRRIETKRKNAQRAAALERTRITKAYLEEDEDDVSEDAIYDDDYANEEIEGEDVDVDVYNAERDDAILASKENASDEDEIFSSRLKTSFK